MIMVCQVQLHELFPALTLFFVVSGFLPKNRLAVMNMSPGDASLLPSFMGSVTICLAAKVGPLGDAS